MTSTLSINVLGGLDVAVNGRPVKIPKKAAALLGYLACQSGKAIPREALADLLWPLQKTKSTRHSLRNCLMEVRKELGPSSSLITDFSHCRLAGESSDIVRLRELAAGDFTSPEILELYQGPLLAGIDIGSESFSDWLLAERRRIEEMTLAALSRLAMQASAAGDHDTAIRAAQRAVSIDELDESSHQQMLVVLLAADRRPEAVRFLGWVRDALHRELGEQPSENTTKLLPELRPTVNEITRLRNALRASQIRERRMVELLDEMLRVKAREAFCALRSRVSQALKNRNQKPAEAE